MALQGAILDVDGTLVLSNDIQAQAWVEAFHAYGYGASFEQVRPLIGMGGDHLVSQIIPAFDSEEGSGKVIADRRKQLVLNQYAAKLAAANGARELVQKMQAAGLKLIAATSATSEELEVLLKAAHVEDLLPEATTADDADSSKPDPDVVEAALEKAQMSPNEVVMLGDTPYDIEAANQVGVKTIAFRCGGFSDEELAGAIAIYNDPADLVAHYDQSPLAQFGQSMVLAEATSPSADFSPVTQSFQKGQWILTQAISYLVQFFRSLGNYIQTNQKLFVNLAFTVGILIAGKLLFAVLDTLNDIPLLSLLLQLVGFVYFIWFANRYLFKFETRQELTQTLQQIKEQVIGESKS
jgi:HAD superfamily hydrolase (TIGR01549 family)